MFFMINSVSQGSDIFGNITKLPTRHSVSWINPASPMGHADTLLPKAKHRIGGWAQIMGYLSGESLGV